GFENQGEPNHSKEKNKPHVNIYLPRPALRSHLSNEDAFFYALRFVIMDSQGKKFGRGPRELTGAVDLISHYKLLAHHDFFCIRSLPLSISDTHYLHNVVGDTEIRKGDGMELDQLFQNAPFLREAAANIQPFDLDILGQAFQLRETIPIDLPSADKGIPTSTGKPKEPKDKTKKHKKHKDKDKEKDKEHKKHKHRHKDKSKDKDKEKEKDKIGHHDSSGDHSKKHHEKKRKLEGSEDVTDIHKHKKSTIMSLVLGVNPNFVLSSTVTLGAISAGLKEPEFCLFNLSRKELSEAIPEPPRPLLYPGPSLFAKVQKSEREGEGKRAAEDRDLLDRGGCMPWRSSLHLGMP
ncbi:hypothetical protein HPP92_020598, partial [Vanilla planifolia]